MKKMNYPFLFILLGGVVFLLLGFTTFIKIKHGVDFDDSISYSLYQFLTDFFTEDRVGDTFDDAYFFGWLGSLLLILSIIISILLEFCLLLVLLNKRKMITINTTRNKNIFIVQFMHFLLSCFILASFISMFIYVLFNKEDSAKLSLGIGYILTLIIYVASFVTLFIFQMKGKVEGVSYFNFKNTEPINKKDYIDAN